jgi:hypothetical protein
VPRRYIPFVAIGIALFIAISAILARVFTAAGAEQAAVTDLLVLEAKGDAPGVIARIQGCAQSATCKANVAYDVAHLKHPGPVSIAQYSPSSSGSLTTTTGVARVAWTVGDSKPIVQCVKVRTAGSAISGQLIQLLVLSRRIRSGADCPKRF